MHNLFLFIYRQPLRRIRRWMALLIFLWGYLGFREGRNKRWRLLNFILFAGTTAAIFYMTVFTRGEGPGEAVLVPFQSFQAAKIQPEMYRSMLMNVFLFVPIGLSLPFVLGKGKLPEFLTVVAALAFTAGIEYMQYRYALGWCEVDDVIMNTLGAVLGTLSHCLSRNWERLILPVRKRLTEAARWVWGAIQKYTK